MIDIKHLRANPDLVREKIALRSPKKNEGKNEGKSGAESGGKSGADENAALLNAALEQDEVIRNLMKMRDEIRAQIKQISKEVAKNAHAENIESPVDSLRQKSKSLGEEEKALEKEITQIQEELKDRLLHIPNLPDENCPIGKSSEDNLVLETDPTFQEDAFEDYQKIPHWEFAVEMGILDMERAVKLSGSMFGMFRGAGAQLSNALIQYALHKNRDLYEEIRPPSLVLTDTLTSTGHLPKFSEDAYFIERDGLWAIPTGEVPLTFLMAGETLQIDQLPVRLMAHTPCFRREAGSAGAQTRGMLRVHEFEKVEILAYAAPEQAQEIHAELLDRAVGLVKDLELNYRVVDICTGDLGASAARTYDVEIYAPGSSRWLEASSVSWFTDYQARRANIRYKDKSKKSTNFIHTLNGSAVAVPRVWAALVETHRQKDGSISVPEVLQPYMSGQKFIQKK